MAVGPSETPVFDFKKAFLWTEIFRTFQVALDPRKLLVAAAGILVMSIGWYLLSVIFYSPTAPDRRDEAQYGTVAVRAKVGDKQPDGKDYTEEAYKNAADRLYQRDLAEWQTLHDLAGPNGRLRTMPWYEYRGPNPFLFVTTIVGGSSVDIKNELEEFLLGTVPVLVEPLRKLLIPVFKLLDPNASTLTRFYILLALIWNVATWAFFGGVITRIAAVQFAGKDRITLVQAVRFVAARYTNYVLSPLVPVGIIALIVIVMAIYGFVAMIPLLDTILYGIGMPLVIVGGIVMAILLIGLVGYPLMYCTLSTEGSDTFDSISRSYNYVFQAPWSYLWYATVSIVYGAIVTLFVIFVGSLMVYMGKWAVTQAPVNDYFNSKPDYLFIYAPESFGWKELLLKGSPVEQSVTKSEDPGSKRRYNVYADANPAVGNAYRESLWVTNKIAAGLTTFWLVLVFLLVIGFSYSYFWSVSTMIYLLMRKKVDDTELDEINADDPLPEITTPKPAPTSPMTPGATASHTPAAPTASLPVVPPTPAPVVPPTPAPVVPPAPAATVAPTPTPAVVPTPTPTPAPAPAPQVEKPAEKPADKPASDAPSDLKGPDSKTTDH